MKMGSYLGVTAAATANPPYFIHLCYKPPSGPVSAKLGLVGKGITFDRYQDDSFLLKMLNKISNGTFHKSLQTLTLYLTALSAGLKALFSWKKVFFTQNHHD